MVGWLIDWMDMSLSRLREIVKDREFWRAADHGVHNILERRVKVLGIQPGHWVQLWPSVCHCDKWEFRVRQGSVNSLESSSCLHTIHLFLCLPGPHSPHSRQFTLPHDPNWTRALAFPS